METIFVAVDHCAARCAGVHGAGLRIRHEALRPSAARERKSGFGRAIVAGLKARHGYLSSTHARQRFEAIAHAA